MSTERELFEAWMSDGGKWPKAVERNGDIYTLMATHTAWSAWQAAWQAARKAGSASPAAWMHEDGRVVPAATMQAAKRDGGAMLSSLSGYTIQLYAAKSSPSTEVVLPELPTADDIDTALANHDVALTNGQRSDVHAAIRELFAARSAIALNRGEDARDAARLRYILDKWIGETEDGWIELNFESVRQASQHPEATRADWMRRDIDSAMEADKAMGGKGGE